MYKILLLFSLFCSITLLEAQDSLVTSDSKAFLETFHSESTISKLEKINKKIFSKNVPFNSSIFFLLILNLLFVSVLLLNVSKSKVKKHFKTLFSINSLTQLVKVESKRNNYHLSAYFIVVNLFGFLLLVIFNEKYLYNMNIAKLINALFIFYSFNFISSSIIAYLLDINELKLLKYFSNSTFLFLYLPLFIVFSLFFISVNISQLKSLLFILIVLFFIIYLWQEFRYLLILSSNKINITSFYFFLYLCTFKILPIIVFVKIILEEF